MDVEQEVAELRSQLIDVANPEKAPEMAAYTKHQFEYLGCSAGERRLAAKSLNQAAKKIGPDELLELTAALWAQPEREFHYVGMDVVRSGAKNLRATDLPAVHGFITATPWWDTVDSLAIHTVGTMVTNHAHLVTEMDEWIESDDLWISRSAILHQLMFKERTDANRLFTYCVMHMESTEFFHRKAIGWALRQYARTDPAAVLGFVAENEGSLSGLSKREALKHLSRE